MKELMASQFTRTELNNWNTGIDPIPLLAQRMQNRYSKDSIVQYYKKITKQQHASAKPAQSPSSKPNQKNEQSLEEEYNKKRAVRKELAENNEQIVIGGQPFVYNKLFV